MRGGQAPYPAVYYASSSLQLATDVQALLLRLGINARLKQVPQIGKGRDQYHVIVSGHDDLTGFVEQVGAVGDYKTAGLNAIRSYLASHSTNTNRDVIPGAVWQSVVVPVMQRDGITQRKLQAGMGMSYCGATLFKQNISRERAQRVAALIDAPVLEALAESDVYWDQIVSVTPGESADVYDMTVDGHHNFVANDMLVHNSIEQDADIVMFIYRDEIYNPDTEFKNIAEISVQKNRNGPTGKLNLYFDNKLTSFKNLAKEKIEL